MDFSPTSQESYANCLCIIIVYSTFTSTCAYTCLQSLIPVAWGGAGTSHF